LRTLVHLSDLHFGRVDHALLQPLREEIESIKPDLLVVSGDLTQRARAAQFREARAYLDTLPHPQIVVPGNHDVPFYNVLGRIFRPLTNYRRFITSDLEPFFVDREMAVLGVNTARALTLKGGRINEEQVERIRAKLCPLDVSITKIVVTHHPFDLPDTHDPDHIVGRAKMAMEIMASCGADILLAGHLHVSHAGNTAARYKFDGYAALVVQAGTATSTRGRGESNSFNVLRIDEPRVSVQRYSWETAGAAFALQQEERFERSTNGWVRGVTYKA
jgi:3',5'-cyclic AMP phosphodiesterase CpdA